MLSSAKINVSHGIVGEFSDDTIRLDRCCRDDTETEKRKETQKAQETEALM